MLFDIEYEGVQKKVQYELQPGVDNKERLCGRIRQEFKLSQNDLIVLRYFDEGDWIHITTSDDVEEIVNYGTPPVRVVMSVTRDDSISLDQMGQSIMIDKKENPVEVVKEEKMDVVNPATVHKDIRCNICLVHPVVGIRYKCIVCNDFDLCASCEAKELHDPTHSLLKMKVAKKESPFQVENLQREPSVPPIVVEHSGGAKLLAKALPAEGVPDRTVLDGGSRQTKVFKFQNNGENHWPAGVRIMQLSGENIVDPDSLEQTLPFVNANSEVSVPISFTVPNQAGRVILYFRLQDQYNEKFGPRFWLDFQVNEVKYDFKQDPKVDAKPEPKPVQLSGDQLKYASQLEELRTMGFGSDEALNLFLLKKFNGEVQQVVNWQLDRKK